jgi:hypothetical protein
MINKYILFIAVLMYSILGSSQTTVQKTEVGYQLMRNGKPYYIKGLGGQVNFDKMVSVGANSFRTWGIEDAQVLLDEAQKRGLTVMLGFWLQHERHGFDYDNTIKVKSQLEHFKKMVDKFKNHPALLLWGIGNELDLDYHNTNCWYAVQDIAKYVHEVDPNHPTSTVTAGLDSLEVQLIKARCPDIDIYGVNTYGDIVNLPKDIGRFGWTGPYMVTEWGPNGHWESPQTDWGVSLEQTSTEKYDSYLTRYQKYIDPNKSHCLGSYAFLWGAKQEYTETWYGLFSKENLPTEPIDALEQVFMDKKIANPAPSIASITIENKIAKENIELKAEEKFKANVVLKNKDLNTKKIQYKWRIIAESSDKKSGGDVEKEADEIPGLITKGVNKPNMQFRAPQEPGMYRVFVSIIANDKIAYANIPIKVLPRAESDKQAKFVKFKYKDMKSFDK